MKKKLLVILASGFVVTCAQAAMPGYFKHKVTRSIAYEFMDDKPKGKEGELLYAIASDDVESVKKILNYGVDISRKFYAQKEQKDFAAENKITFFKSSFLMMAIFCWRVDIVSLLLDHPDIQVNDGFGNNGFGMTVVNNFMFHTVSAIGYTGIFPLFGAICQRNVSLVKALLSKGARIDPVCKVTLGKNDSVEKDIFDVIKEGCSKEQCVGDDIKEIVHALLRHVGFAEQEATNFVSDFTSADDARWLRQVIAGKRAGYF